MALLSRGRRADALCLVAGATAAQLQRFAFASLASKQGGLHIVGTPIGNPDDISIRSLRVLSECRLLLGKSGAKGVA